METNLKKEAWAVNPHVSQQQLNHIKAGLLDMSHAIKKLEQGRQDEFIYREINTLKASLVKIKNYALEKRIS